jgi:helicase SWR1
VDEMRRRGHMLRRPPNSQSPSGSGTKGPQRVPDHWDQIIREMQEHAKTRRAIGKYVASQVAARIKGYWEAQALRDDKVRAQEEKRLRALAKGTIRLVIAKWKEAVYVRRLCKQIYPSDDNNLLFDIVYPEPGAQET